MTLAFYISAHGFGHFIREIEVMRALPREMPMLVRSEVPAWLLDQQLKGRNVKHLPARFDCGALGPDSMSLDAARTFRTMAEIQQANEARLDREIELLGAHDVRLVVADVVPFALRVAAEAGLPSVLIANFTWVEIYRDLLERLRAAGDAAAAEFGERVIRCMEAEYRLGGLLLKPGFDMPMEACRRQRRVPIIARKGRNRREELCRRLGFDPARPLYLVYLGRDGYEGMEWERLGSLPDAQFFGFVPTGPADSPIRVLPGGEFDHGDAAASADAAIGKPGYSICAECAATGTPILYPPRPDFAEFPALDAAMRDLGLALPLTTEEFRAVKWEQSLSRVPALREAFVPVDCEGARVCARTLLDLYAAPPTV